MKKKCAWCRGVGAMAGAHSEKVNPCPYCKGKGTAFEEKP